MRFINSFWRVNNMCKCLNNNHSYWVERVTREDVEDVGKRQKWWLKMINKHINLTN